MWEPYHLEFDFVISELLLETANPVHIWQRSQAAKSFGKTQVFGPPKTRAQPVSEAMKTRLLRRVIATAYSCGMIGKVPWDVFDQSPDGKSRYFAKPSDVADLYAFVRGQQWDGYRETAAFGDGLNKDNAASEKIVVKNSSGGIYTFVRAPVQQGNEDLLIHLVDWGIPEASGAQRGRFRSPSGEYFVMYSPAENINRTEAEPFEILLQTDAFDDWEKLSFELLTPAEYNSEAHAKAFETGDYEGLVRRDTLIVTERNGQIHLEIPALDPWGIIRVSHDG